jgi:hypothetical protein
VEEGIASADAHRIARHSRIRFRAELLIEMIRSAPQDEFTEPTGALSGYRCVVQRRRPGSHWTFPS